MTKISGQTLNFGFSIEEQISTIQSFTSEVFTTSFTSRSYRAIEDFGAQTLGEVFFTGSFSTEFGFASTADDVSGPISALSFTYFEFDLLDDPTGLSGVFQVDDLGRNSIDFVDFLGLQPSAVAQTILKGKDKITGSSFNDFLDGFTGKDNIKGGDGDDEIIGGNGKDKLFGEKGNDILKGGNGADFLDGGKGRNTLFGGKGPDTFKFSKKGSSRVRDFNPLEDFIDVPGPESQFNQFGFIQKNDNTILLGIFAEDIANDFNLQLKSKTPFTIDDVNFI